MSSPDVVELAQRVVRAYIVDLARNGPIDICQFTDEELRYAEGVDPTEVDKAAIAILQQIGRDLLTP